MELASCQQGRNKIKCKRTNGICKKLIIVIVEKKESHSALLLHDHKIAGIHVLIAFYQL
jgi:hypothetical protein